MKAELAQVYDQSFYDHQVAESLAAARQYLALLWRYVQPKSVLDVGCGRGAWLSACRELGSTNLFGFDGEWNRQSQMIDNAIVFRPIDLRQPFSLGQTVDLAMSLEVAEHLDASSADTFVGCLAASSDAIVFSAAYPGQGGAHHVNEQPQSYWARHFEKRDFVPFDLFRPVFWGNEAIPFWYRQNVFLYAKAGSESFDRLTKADAPAIADISFMDCVHPVMFERARITKPTWKSHVRDFIPSIVRAVRRS